MAIYFIVCILQNKFKSLEIMGRNSEGSARCSGYEFDLNNNHNIYLSFSFSLFFFILNKYVAIYLDFDLIILINDKQTFN